MSMQPAMAYEDESVIGSVQASVQMAKMRACSGC